MDLSEAQKELLEECEEKNLVWNYDDGEINITGDIDILVIEYNNPVIYKPIPCKLYKSYNNNKIIFISSATHKITRITRKLNVNYSDDIDNMNFLHNMHYTVIIEVQDTDNMLYFYEIIQQHNIKAAE